MQHRQRSPILRLPPEILHPIFQHFCEPPSYHESDLPYISKPKARAAAALATVRSCRLVCRLFNEFASPLLLPSLYVHLDQDSLDFADEVARNPLVASGVQTVYVVLRYCPRELADDFKYFARFASQRVQAIEQECGDRLEMMEIENRTSDDDPGPYGSYRDTEQIRNRISHLYSAFNRAADDSDEEGDNVAEGVREEHDRDERGRADGERSADSRAQDTPRFHEYRHLLWRAHQLFRYKHKQQLGLITSGTFVINLAATMAKLPRATSVIFVEESTVISEEPFHYKPERLFEGRPGNDEGDTISGYLAWPLCWTDVEQLPHVADIPPARILSELPIALHKAGVSLRAVRIAVRLTRNNHMAIRHFTDYVNGESKMTHDEGSPSLPQVPAWDELRAASQHLERFYMHEPFPTYRDPPPLIPVEREVQDDCINTFLGCFLCNPLLEDIYIDMFQFYQGDGDYVSDQKLSYPLGPVLAAMPALPRIKWLNLEYIQAEEAQLAKFCRGLGTSRMEKAGMHVVYAGRFEAIRDILEQKFGTKPRFDSLTWDDEGLTTMWGRPRL